MFKVILLPSIPGNKSLSLVLVKKLRWYGYSLFYESLILGVIFIVKNLTFSR